MKHLCCLAFGLSLLGHAAFAADGDLDVTFGVGGKATFHVNMNDRATALAVSPDGRIYLAGRVESFSRMGVVRVMPNGTIDGSYGVGGTFLLESNSDDIVDAALQSDGKLIIAMRDNCGNCDNVKQQVCRITVTGSGLDTTFGDPSTPGCRSMQNDNDLQINAIAVQADGKILLAGDKVSEQENKPNVWLSRLDAQGDPDVQFGALGEIVLPSAYISELTDVALAPDGKIVAVGRMGDNVNFEVFRWFPNGVSDQTFGVGGRQSVAFDLGPAQLDFAASVSVLGDGLIVVAGNIQPMQANAALIPALARLRADGSQDPDFGDGGKRTYNPCAFTFGTCSYTVADMVVQSDGKIVVAGWHSGATTIFFAMRVHQDGTPDTSFGLQSGIPQGVMYFGIGVGVTRTG